MFDELIAANRRYASGFSLQGIPGTAAKGFGLVTCMDSRIEPLVMLGLSQGDAKILRNAGGRVTSDVLRSLVLATTFLGVEYVAVMHHTDCALAGRDDAEVRSGLSPQQLEGAQGWEFLAMPDPDAALAADVNAVRTCEALPAGIRVEGWRYDVATGAVLQVIPNQALSARDTGG
jgi:carbonic anhydrase